ncbi:leucine-rich repeat extensin-like protein 3 [Galendromus occidentalis]|uniref:Leucine-rich repeat extensin-like protein 3 n=1 Tax=Galendromus occidentalis TaxID=34638 RepID=A0AAJ7SEL9_9ACAR|nr:leucine-rich repeat extensin-like protein 3 [Galendromus occidentalis]
MRSLRQDKTNSPKTPGRKRGSTGKFFSPKEDSATAFKPNSHSMITNLKNTNKESNNKTSPNFNKRIAFLQDNPFQGSPQAFFFFTNVGPNHIEYRGVFSPSAVPLNFKDSPDALFQLIPQLPKLFNFDNRGIPPPQEPPKPRQPLPPRLPLPTPQIIEDPVPLAPIELPPAAPLSHSPPRLPLNPPPPPPPPPPVPADVPQRPSLIQPEPPRQVYPLALPPPPNLQLADRPINQPFPKYDFVRGSFDGYPKIFRFNDERISILDFDKQKKAGQVIRRKGDDLDPERVPRNSFLIFHGGQFPSKEDSLSRNRLDTGVKNNRFRNFVDFGNFLE